MYSARKMYSNTQREYIYLYLEHASMILIKSIGIVYLTPSRSLYRYSHFKQKTPNPYDMRYTKDVYIFHSLCTYAL